MQFTKMPREAAPAAPRPTTRFARRRVEMERQVTMVLPSEAGAWEPEGAETVRGIRTRVARAATRLGMREEVTVWDDGARVYLTWNVG